MHKEKTMAIKSPFPFILVPNEDDSNQLVSEHQSLFNNQIVLVCNED